MDLISVSLRPDFLVKRDYAAANHIIGEAFANSDVGFRERTRARPDTILFFNITKNHSRNFYGKEIKPELRTLQQKAATRSSDLKILKECFAATLASLKESLAKIEDLHRGSWDCVFASEFSAYDAQFSEKSLTTLVSFAHTLHMKHNALIEHLKYEEVIASADEWLSFHKKISTAKGSHIPTSDHLNPNTKKENIANFLTAFAEEIKLRIQPVEIELDKQKISESKGELIIAGQCSGFSIARVINESSRDEIADSASNPEHSLPDFTVSSRHNFNPDESLNIDEALYVDYGDGVWLNSQNNFSALYVKVGEMINSKITKHENRSHDGSKDDATPPDSPYVVHMTVLIPFSRLSITSDKLTADEKNKRWKLSNVAHQSGLQKIPRSGSTSTPRNLGKR